MHKVRKDGETPHGGVLMVTSACNKYVTGKGIQSSWGQANFRVQEPDPRDVVAYTLHRYEPSSQEGGVITYCRYRRVDEL